MDFLHQASVLEKVAQVIEDLECKVSELQAKLSERDESLGQIKKASYSSTVADLMSKGFSEDEATVMVNTLPGSALDKVASFSKEGGDWNMGSVSDMPSKSGDPLLDFITS